MDLTKEPLGLLSTCVGMRGIERGIERAFLRLGWHAPKPLAYVEIEAFAAWNLVEQMEIGILAPTPVWSNLKTFQWHLFRGMVGLLTGGYPCQPFSLAGKRQGVSDPRHLWPFLRRGIDTVKPLGCFFENVRQHLNVGYESVRRDLEGLDYQVREGIFSAEEIGAPHKRDRLFILALRNDFVDHLCSGRYDDSIRKVQTGRLCPQLPGDEMGKGEMGDSDGARLAFGKEQPTWQKLTSLERTGFPLGQGIEQYAWEAPRIKSRLDFSVNGYDFTSDLLRMAGNGVVEQVAELAFICLLSEHLAL